MRNRLGRDGRKTEWQEAERKTARRGEETKAPPPPPRKGGELQIVVGASGGHGRGQLKIQLVIQRVQDVRGGECIVLWDSGAQVSLVTHEYARGAGLRRRPASIRITGVGEGSGGESCVQYKALLRRRDDSVAEIRPYGVDKIYYYYSIYLFSVYIRDILQYGYTD